MLSLGGTELTATPEIATFEVAHDAVEEQTPTAEAVLADAGVGEEGAAQEEPVAVRAMAAPAPAALEQDDSGTMEPNGGDAVPLKTAGEEDGIEAEMAATHPEVPDAREMDSRAAEASPVLPSPVGAGMATPEPTAGAPIPTSGMTATPAPAAVPPPTPHLGQMGDAGVVDAVEEVGERTAGAATIPAVVPEQALGVEEVPPRDEASTGLWWRVAEGLLAVLAVSVLGLLFWRKRRGASR